MELTYWFKQTADKPLFPDMLWSRPENRRLAGKLLIVGGNAHSFAAVAQAYQHSLAAGAGVVRIVLPDILKKPVGALLEEVVYAASTPSGSLGSSALAEIMEQINWSDGALLAGDFGRNSETAILIEKLVQKTNTQISASQDAADYLSALKISASQQSKLNLVLDFAQLQKLAKLLNPSKPINSSIGLLQLVEYLHNLTEKFSLKLIIAHQQNIIVAVNGQICSTKSNHEISSIEIASYCSTWWLQNPSKAFEALSCAIVSLII